MPHAGNAQLTSPPGLPNIFLLNPTKWLPNTLAVGRLVNRWLERRQIRRACRRTGLIRTVHAEGDIDEVTQRLLDTLRAGSRAAEPEEPVATKARANKPAKKKTAKKSKVKVVAKKKSGPKARVKAKVKQKARPAKSKRRSERRAESQKDGEGRRESQDQAQAQRSRTEAPGDSQEIASLPFARAAISLPAPLTTSRRRLPCASRATG